MRAFGGIKSIMLADFWQLVPVTRTNLCVNLLYAPPDGLAADALRLFWTDGMDSIRGLTEVCDLIRCKDEW